MDQATAIEHARKYAGLVVEEIKPLKVILFGSYVKGNWNENSDIDIAVIIDKIDDKYLLISKHLHKLTQHIDNRIEPVLLQQENDRSGFLTTILQTGITLYENAN